MHSFVLSGIDSIQCEVETDVSQRGLAKTAIVGLAQAAVKESIERVRRAIINSGYPFPGHGVAINLYNVGGVIVGSTLGSTLLMSDLPRHVRRRACPGPASGARPAAGAVRWPSSSRMRCSIS